MFEPWEILSTRAINCLMNDLGDLGIVEFGPMGAPAPSELDQHAQVVADLGREHWVSVPHCGRVTVANIERWLNAHGIEFK